mmetsp:Transcript_11911/g.27786  ORF Transcript_11911/g.27786 Transcript_11911/m.27786 type:complete len:211 (-) Transcript_11911:557-1189(-)
MASLLSSFCRNSSWPNMYLCSCTTAVRATAEASISSCPAFAPGSSFTHLITSDSCRSTASSCANSRIALERVVLTPPSLSKTSLVANNPFPSLQSCDTMRDRTATPFCRLPMLRRPRKSPLARMRTISDRSFSEHNRSESSSRRMRPWCMSTLTTSKPSNLTATRLLGRSTATTIPLTHCCLLLLGTFVNTSSSSWTPIPPKTSASASET